MKTLTRRVSSGFFGAIPHGSMTYYSAALAPRKKTFSWEPGYPLIAKGRPSLAPDATDDAPIPTTAIAPAQPPTRPPPAVIRLPVLASHHGVNGQPLRKNTPNSHSVPCLQHKYAVGGVSTDGREHTPPSGLVHRLEAALQDAAQWDRALDALGARRRRSAGSGESDSISAFAERGADPLSGARALGAPLLSPQRHSRGRPLEEGSEGCRGGEKVPGGVSTIVTVRHKYQGVFGAFDYETLRAYRFPLNTDTYTPCDHDETWHTGSEGGHLPLALLRALASGDHPQRRYRSEGPAPRSGTRVGREFSFHQRPAATRCRRRAAHVVV